MEQLPTHLTLETPQQLSARVGIPISNVRYLLKQKLLDHVFTSPGKRNPKIPPGAWERYLEKEMVRPNE